MMIRLIILCSLVFAFLLGCTLPSCLNPTIPPPAPITRAPTLTPTLTETIAPTNTTMPPTETATPTSTQTISPTATELPPTETNTPTVMPSATPTQTRVVTKPGRDTLPMPTTGGAGPTWDMALLLAGIGLVVVGGLALWASKDNPTW